ncbi:MAG: YicC family protein [Rikenellaceae bacterium]|nr:YicC family protein [Rikenellaceae bacterium]
MTEIRSMTGYGKGSVVCGDRRITVEIKTLNGKQMDLSVKIPSLYRSKEFDIRSLVTKRLLRGKADIFVTYETIEGKAASPVDAAMFTEYYRQIEKAASPLGLETRSGEVIAAVLRMPDVVKAPCEQLGPEEEAALMEAATEAVTRLDDFRRHEGEILIADIMKRVDRIEKLSVEAASYDAERVEAVRKRIKDNIEAGGITVDPNRFEQELIFYIEKLDITEEKVRLKKHIDYFRRTVAEDEAPGRKIGFICQEMGREINTTGSKANHAEMQRIVVEMKDELEKIKEQSLNIL